MTQEEALAILKTGVNVFLTGEAGSGKTHTINRYVAYLREHGVDPAITASTGIAATHIHGMTLHSWSGVGIMRNLKDEDIVDIARSRHIASRIKKARVLIIDEVSMIDASMLSAVERICRRVRRSDIPFGGIQVVLVGDFFQLPPVAKGEENVEPPFLSVAWRLMDLKVCYLTEQHRQEDPVFLEILTAIRQNTFDENHFQYLQARMVVWEEIPSETTRLFSHNVDVDAINAGELAKLPGKGMAFRMAERGPERLVEALKRGCLSPERLRLKEGATVMFTKNNPNLGFANGTLGMVAGFDGDKHFPIVELCNGRRVLVEPTEWLVEEAGEPLAKITQIPLRLAWAITIHKSQGMSLDAAVMDLSRVFEFGQGYVALSRVRKLSGVYLLGVNARAFAISPVVFEQDQVFREQSRTVQEMLAQLSPEELLKRQKDFIHLCGGRWEEETKEVSSKESSKKLEKEKPEKAYSVDTIRATYPHAYQPWTEEEEATLKKLFDQKLSVKKISEHMGRQPGSIRSRLRKLELAEE
jgi:ATP-dependent DNA helicase PIF1